MVKFYSNAGQWFSQSNFVEKIPIIKKERRESSSLCRLSFLHDLSAGVSRLNVRFVKAPEIIVFYAHLFSPSSRFSDKRPVVDAFSNLRKTTVVWIRRCSGWVVGTVITFFNVDFYEFTAFDYKFLYGNLFSSADKISFVPDPNICALFEKLQSSGDVG